MDQDLIAALARAAGLDKALAEFPDDVAAAAAQALNNAGVIQFPDRPGSRAVAADARGYRPMTEAALADRCPRRRAPSPRARCRPVEYC